jgi:fructoselysine and glucoselysine-specific PTS system IIC component
MAIGSYIPPDSAVGGVLATAFAIKAGLGSEAALALAIPIAIIATSFQNVLWSIHSLTSKIADKYADQGNEKGIYAIMFLEGGLNILLKFFLVFFAWMFGSEQVAVLLNGIPEWFVAGMSVAGGILPAIGMAMLMRMIMNKKVAPYYFLGFALAAYFGLPVLGVAVLGVILVFIKFDFNTKAMQMEKEAVPDDDF